MEDKEFGKVKVDLKEELHSEISKTYHKTGMVAYDHGTSSDRFRTKQLGVAFVYVNEGFEIKVETLGEIKAVGSQTGPVIRGMVRDLLVERVGWEPDWKLCPTTDGASNVVSSRSITRHGHVGLNIVFENNCVDHTVHLVIELAVEGVTIAPLPGSIAKVRAAVNYLKQNHLALEFFLNIQDELGMDVITPCQGTSNW